MPGNPKLSNNLRYVLILMMLTSLRLFECAGISRVVNELDMILVFDVRFNKLRYIYRWDRDLDSVSGSDSRFPEKSVVFFG